MTADSLDQPDDMVLDHRSIGAIVRLNLDAWRTTLSVEKGIYVLTDRDDGKLCVGKADVEKGFWGDGKIILARGMAVTWGSEKRSATVTPTGYRTLPSPYSR